MRKFSYVILLALFLFSCNKVTVGPTLKCANEDLVTHPKYAELQQILSEYTQKGLPGISVLFIDSSGVCATGAGKADIAEDVDFTACTVSKVASITKMFVGVVALQLVDEGVLDLDKKALEWLTADVVSKVKNLEDCTLRMLLNHTTGIYDVITGTGFYLDLLNNPDQTWENYDLLQHVYGKEPYFPAGTKCSYSNTNTLLVSMIIDEATGHSHAIEIKNRIIDKLGLTRTYYFPHDSVPPITAQGYYDLYNNGTILNMANYHTGPGNGYGGIYSNVFDLQVFIHALYKSKILLSQKMLDEMLQFEYPEGDDRGLGLSCMKDFNYRTNKNEFGYGHRGRDLGYSGDLYYFPNQGFTLSMLVNYGTNGSTPIGDFYYQLRDDLVDLLMK